MDYALRERFFNELDKEIQELIDPQTGLLSEKFSQVIDCPLCEVSVVKQEELFRKKGYTFVRCLECGMIFSNPQVKEDYINQFYGKSKAEDIWVELQKSDKEKSWKKDYYVNCIQIIKKIAGKENIRLLDIGCSTGYFLELIKRYEPSWKARGLELSQKAYEYAITKGLDVRKTLLTDLAQEEKYNVVTMFGVMEHLTNPKVYLHNIVKHAPSEDIFVLAIVPNAYSLYHMFLQDKSVSFDGRDHLLYFSEKTLKTLFEMNGFEVKHLDTVLAGFDAIKKQIQWYDPYAQVDSEDFIPDKIKPYFDNGKLETFMYKHNLGLRLRILAKYKGKV